MKYLKISLLFFTLGLMLNISAQQDPHFSMYKYNLSVVNPAVAGINNRLEFYGGIREQWTSVPGAPSTQTFNVNTNLSDKVGLGFNAINDNIFIVNEVHLYADFSYKLQLNDAVDIFLGLKAGGSFLDIDLNSLEIDNDLFLSGNVSRFNPNVGIGIYLKGKDYYISFSTPGLLENDRIEKDGFSVSKASDRVHTFLSGGYNYDVSDTWAIKPSTMLRTVIGTTFSLDMTLLAQYMNKFEFGANYRLDESITGIASLDLDNFGKVGFAYEHTLTDVADYTNGTVEVFMKFIINNKRK